MRGKGDGSLYKRASDGLWVATVELPPREGKRRRRVVTGRTRAIAAAKLREERKKLEGTGDIAGGAQTVGQWLTYWHRAIVVARKRPRTAETYDGVIRRLLIPELGHIRLDRLTADDVRRMHDRLRTGGKSPAYVLSAHRVLSAALNVAEAEGRVGRNAARLAKAPPPSVKQLEVLTLEECRQLLNLANAALNAPGLYDPYPMRWAVALLTGARRGEILGLQVDRVEGVIDLSWQLQRLSASATPPPDYEMRPVGGGLYLTRPKSQAGWRQIPLVEPLETALARHRERMDENPWGLLFTQGGRPIDPRADSRAWTRLLVDLGITRPVRQHDIRHATVDLYYAAGTPEVIIGEIIGHSSRAMTRAYRSRSDLGVLASSVSSMYALLEG